MSDERYEGDSFNRRRVLSGLGVAGVSSLAGCANPLVGGSNDTGPSSLDSIRLEQIPTDAGVTSDRLVVPSKDVIETFGLRHLQQIRVARPGQSFPGDFLSALYTAKTDVDFNTKQKKTLWMSEAALDRINAGVGWYVSVLPNAPHPEIDTKADARDSSEFIEQSIHSGRDLLVCAPHGGDIYPFTDTQALRVSSELSESAWVCMGYNQGGGARDRWFIDQTLVHPASFPKMGELVSYDGDTDEDVNHEYDRTYDYGVLFEGTEKPGVYIGGLVKDEVKETVKKAIVSELHRAGRNDIQVSIVWTGALSATDTKNIANRVSDDGHHGLQIAQGKEVRELYWKPVADAVITAFSDN